MLMRVSAPVIMVSFNLLGHYLFLSGLRGPFELYDSDNL